MDETRGFILQPSYRVENGRPVIHIYGKLESGESFLVRDDRVRPCFYIRNDDVDDARACGAREIFPTERRALTGEPVSRVAVAIPSEAPPIRRRLQDAGILCYEADVRFAMRYLIDRGIRASLTIHGVGEPGDGGDLVFENPSLSPGDWTPELSVLSFDIETDPQAHRLLSIGLFGCGASEVLILSKPEETPDGAVPCVDEKTLIENFCRRVRDIDPDIITGWNINEFDFPVLDRVAKRCGTTLELGRGPGDLRLPRGGRGMQIPARVPGRVVLDAIPLLRGAFIRMESYALDFVAREALGEGKTISGGSRGEEILRQYHEDRARFVEYNLTDARLVIEILDHFDLMKLTVERSRLTGMPPDRVSSSIAAFDFLYLTELGRRGVVAPTVGNDDDNPQPTSGGHVMEPLPGMFENILVFDFKSLYPSIIRTFQIDPLGLVRGNEEGDFVEAPNGAKFRREPGVLTGILDELFPAREAAKREGNSVASQAIKILMNSFYGVLGTPACRFHNGQIANAITSFGRELLLWSRDRCEARGLRVLYGDTDSLFVESGCPQAADAWKLGSELLAELNDELTSHLREKWGVESRLELELEKLYLRLFLPAVRHGTEGARKRYAGLVEVGAEKQVTFTGMEAVRSDWTELARTFQRDLYERLFLDKPIPAFLRKLVEEVRSGQHDDRLVYKKSIRKDLAAYTATTPPHVAAARKLTHKPGRSIRYIITIGGPEPAEQQMHPLDHEHYVRKQIQPIAEPVLALLNTSFDAVIGGSQQLELF